MRKPRLKIQNLHIVPPGSDWGNRIAHVYEIRNLVNGNSYIGSTLNLYNRLVTHFSSLRNGVHYNKPLQADFLEAGEENFSIDIIGTVAFSRANKYRYPNCIELRNLERELIKERQPAYNRHSKKAQAA